jgi:hypothetical protein
MIIWMYIGNKFQKKFIEIKCIRLQADDTSNN